MNESRWTDNELRSFLLGGLTGPEREELECHFLTDEAFNSRLISAEELLVDEYLHQGLSVSDQRRFRAQYANTPSQRRGLRIAESLKDHAHASANKHVITLPTKSIGWFGRFKSGSSYLLPIAALSIVVLVLGGFWISRRVNETTARQVQVENELKALNAGGDNQIPPRETRSIILAPMSLRSSEARTSVSTSGEVRVVEFGLIWSQPERSPTYLANIKRVGGSESFTVRLQSAEKSNQEIIFLKIPARILTPGLYQITLTGESGSRHSEEYQVTCTSH